MKLKEISKKINCIVLSNDAYFVDGDDEHGNGSCLYICIIKIFCIPYEKTTPERLHSLTAPFSFFHFNIRLKQLSPSPLFTLAFSVLTLHSILILSNFEMYQVKQLLFTLLTHTYRLTTRAMKIGTAILHVRINNYNRNYIKKEIA